MAANQLRGVSARIGFTNGADENIVDVQGIESMRELVIDILPELGAEDMRPPACLRLES